MNQRFLMWGLASITFVVTLTITSWNEGLWQADQTAAPAHNVRVASLTSENPTDLPFRPFVPTPIAQPAPAAPVETVAAVKSLPPPPDPAPQEEPPPADEPSTQVSAQELDEEEFQSHRDRAAEHSARSR